MSEEVTRLDDSLEQDNRSTGKETMEYVIKEYELYKLDEKTLSIDGVKYALRENYRDALDCDQLSQRYSQFFEKFDFIVGDLGYDLLRLRGFYYDETKGVPLDMRISTLEDYLTEYCNFGCPYFILERLDEKTVFPSYDRRDRLKNQDTGKRKNRKSNKRKTQKKVNKAKGQTKTNWVKSGQKFEKKKIDNKFDHKKKQRKQEVRVQEVKDQEGKKRFEIKKSKGEA